MNPESGRFFDDLSGGIQQSEEGDVPEQNEDCGVPDSMLPMINSFQVQPSTPTAETGNSPQVEQTGSYYEFSKSMRLRKTFAVNSETSFADELSQDINHGPNVSGKQVRLTQCKQSPCNILTDYDEAYACWHPEAVDHLQKEQHVEHIGEADQHSMSMREPESSNSACEIRNPAQRSVSFTERPAERTSTRQQFDICRCSTSLSDSIFPSPLISPRLRGPSFSKKFKEHMLTLPMPPAEHLVPFESRHSSTASTTAPSTRPKITLSSKKPKGFWAKLGALFKGCFGAR